MNKIFTTAAVPLAAGITAGLIAAGCSSSSSSTVISGTETLQGTAQLTSAQVNDQHFVPTIPLTASGAFSDTGSIALTPGSGPDGNGPGPAVIKLGKGNIKVQHAAGSNNQPVRLKGTCTYEVTQKVGYAVTGGTGKYTGATGHGTATVTFDFSVPVLPGNRVSPANGGPVCDTRSSTQAIGGKVVFSAVGPVSVPPSAGATTGGVPLK